MSINLSLADVFEEAFGYRSSAFEPTFEHLPPQRKMGAGGSEFFVPQNPKLGTTGAAYYTKEATGQEYYLPVKLSYTKPGTTEYVQAYLPHPVISVTGKKTIIETPLTERRGTVKEVINLSDYEIVIKGIIMSPDNEYPEEAVSVLRDIFEMNVAVSIANPITDIFLMRPATAGSDKVVIKELSFPEVKGAKNVRPYQMTMVSDAPFNLIDLK